MHATILVIGTDPTEQMDRFITFTQGFKMDSYKPESALPLLKRPNMDAKEEDFTDEWHEENDFYTHKEKISYVHSAPCSEVDIEEVKCFGILTRGGLVSCDTFFTYKCGWDEAREEFADYLQTLLKDMQANRPEEVLHTYDIHF